MVYSTGARRTHSMDLRRIVEEVEERKRYELSLVRPAEPSPGPPTQGGGAAGSLLVAVRDRMLAEDPEADVAHIEEALGNAPPADAAEAPEGAPAKRATARANMRAQEASQDDFLSRYLELSVEFEARYGIKGWADFVAKKTESRPARHPPVPSARRAKAKGKRKTRASERRK